MTYASKDNGEGGTSTQVESVESFSKSNFSFGSEAVESMSGNTKAGAKNLDDIMKSLAGNLANLGTETLETEDEISAGHEAVFENATANNFDWSNKSQSGYRDGGSSVFRPQLLDNFGKYQAP